MTVDRSLVASEGNVVAGDISRADDLQSAAVAGILHFALIVDGTGFVLLEDNRVKRRRSSFNSHCAAVCSGLVAREGRIGNDSCRIVDVIDAGGTRARIAAVNSIADIKAVRVADIADTAADAGVAAECGTFNGNQRLSA